MGMKEDDEDEDKDERERIRVTISGFRMEGLILKGRKSLRVLMRDYVVNQLVK